MMFREAITDSPTPLPPINDLEVLETRAEIPYCPRVCTQIWVVGLIGWCKFLTRHDQSEKFLTRHDQSELGSETSFA